MTTLTDRGRMMHLPPEKMLYEGVAVDVLFGESRPMFGDLFLICGIGPHPDFPPSGSFRFDRLSDLQFSQIDDFFGVRSLADAGANVAVWLYPLVDRQAVRDHAGTYDGVRLTYNVLRNPARFAPHYLHCVRSFSDFGRQVRYVSRETDLGTPPDLSVVQADIASINEFWAERGVEAGSEDALLVDY